MNLMQGEPILCSVVLMLVALGARHDKRPNVAAVLATVAFTIFVLGVLRDAGVIP